jgi:hypothetical protein
MPPGRRSGDGGAPDRTYLAIDPRLDGPDGRRPTGSPPAARPARRPRPSGGAAPLPPRDARMAERQGGAGPPPGGPGGPSGLRPMAGRSAQSTRLPQWLESSHRVRNSGRSPVRAQLPGWRSARCAAPVRRCRTRQHRFRPGRPRRAPWCSRPRRRPSSLSATLVCGSGPARRQNFGNMRARPTRCGAGVGAAAPAWRGGGLDHRVERLTT